MLYWSQITSLIFLGGLWRQEAISRTARSILLIFYRPIAMAKYGWCTKFRHDRPNILDFIRYFHYHGNGCQFIQNLNMPWPTHCPSRPVCAISSRSVHKWPRSLVSKIQRFGLLWYDDAEIDLTIVMIICSLYHLRREYWTLSTGIACIGTSDCTCNSKTMT